MLGEERRDARFAYYLIQLRIEREDGVVRSSGTLEDLGSGERVSFSDLQGLVGILSCAKAEHR